MPPRYLNPGLFALVPPLVVAGLHHSYEVLHRKIVSQISPSALVGAGEGFPSRRRRPAGPRPGGPGGAPRRTYDLDHPGAVWLPSVCVGKQLGGHPGAPGSRAGSPGRRRRWPVLPAAVSGVARVG